VKLVAVLVGVALAPLAIVAGFAIGLYVGVAIR
jgi:hypothetical protein